MRYVLLTILLMLAFAFVLQLVVFDPLRIVLTWFGFDMGLTETPPILGGGETE